MEANKNQELNEGGVRGNKEQMMDCIKCAGLSYIRYLSHRNQYFIACYECPNILYGNEEEEGQSVIYKWNKVNKKAKILY